MSSYNYISLTWEPVIEFMQPSLNYLYENKKHKINIEMDKLLLNLSDMSITFTLSIISKWMRKFKELEGEKLNNNILENSKYSNNKIYNYTGKDISYIYYGQTYQCPNLEKGNLDYINYWDTTKFGPKQVTLIFNEEEKFNVPVGKIGMQTLPLKNRKKIIVENTLSPDRQVNIYLYSPIIFKNKSVYPLTMTLTNNANRKNISIILQPKTIQGIPDEFVDKETTVNFENKTLSLADILKCKKEETFERHISLNSKVFYLKLTQKIKDVRKIIISTEFSVINCLPCDAYLFTKKEKILIKKGEQFCIDFSSDPDTFYN